LTTRRHTEADILEIMADPVSFGLQLRLLDRFGDNGIIAVIIGRLQRSPGTDQGKDLYIDTWLMSCRVLGRQVESATLDLIVTEAARLGARRVVGEYIPTKKNNMVRDHYIKLGFAALQADPGGGNRSALDVVSYRPADSFIHVIEG
jgi:FkbH-like protein